MCSIDEIQAIVDLNSFYSLYSLNTDYTCLQYMYSLTYNKQIIYKHTKKLKQIRFISSGKKDRK